jgi:hypothetical protein
MTAPTAHLDAARMLGVPVTEITSVDEHPEAGHLVITADGQGYVLTADGDVAYAWPPTSRYAGTFPVWAGWDAAAVVEPTDALSDDGDTGGISDDDDDDDDDSGDDELQALADLTEDDLTALELLAEEGLTADDVIALAATPGKPTPAVKPGKPEKPGKPGTSK